MFEPVQCCCVDIMSKLWIWITSVIAGFTVLCLRQCAVIDNSDDYTLPMGEGGRVGGMRRGRARRKGHNDTNDNYRLANTWISNKVAATLVLRTARHLLIPPYRQVIYPAYNFNHKVKRYHWGWGGTLL